MYKIIQVSCIEGKGVDMRQANAVLKHKPDLIIQEAPSNGKTSESIFNKFPPSKKPLKYLEETNKSLKETSKKYPWHLSVVYTLQNIQKLWESGHDIKIYNVDAPSELLRETLIHKWNQIEGPHRRGTHKIWWVYIYLREKFMTKFVSQILKSNKNKEVTILVLMQKFHWINVKFQLSHTEKEIWEFYFGKFKNLKPKDLKEFVKKENPILYKYWSKNKF